MRRFLVLLVSICALIGVVLGAGFLSQADAAPPVKSATFSVTSVSTLATADSFGVANATLTCPAGTTPTGGWWDLDSLNGSVTTNEPDPLTNNQWRIYATQLSSGQVVTLGVLCGSLSTS